MKFVIYKTLGGYCVTPEENYHATVQDARQIQRLDDFESAEEVIDYYCKYCKCRPEDFIVIGG